MNHLALGAYSAVTRLLWPAAVWRWQRRAKAEPLYGQWMAERSGHYGPEVAAAPRGSPRVWVHAVSLGETRAAASLVAALRQSLPGMQLLLTHGTATGRAEGQKLLAPGDLQVWAPFDTPAATQRFFAALSPRVGVLLETEVWPNLVASAHAAGVPLVLANARLSASSLRWAQRLGALARPAYAAFAQVLAQTQADAERLVAAGVASHRVQVLGNLKFDMAVDDRQLAAGRSARQASERPLLMLASSREGEEAQLLEAWRALKAQAGGVPPHGWAAWPRLLVVPRHPQRFDEVAALAGNAGLAVARASAGEDPSAADLLLGDTMGEMPRYFGMADVALLGGSFGGTGGQNLIEAAACGCPLVMGPSTFNFAQAAELALAAGAAQRAPDMPEALHLALDWLARPAELSAAAQAGLAFAQAHRGASARMAAAVSAQAGR